MPFSVEGKNVTVIGGGRSGVAAAELLMARGARVTVADASPLSESAALAASGATLEIGPHRPDQFLAADLLVLSPGVPPNQPAIEAARLAGVPVTGEIELASRWLQGRVIAITGTKGKSTTTTLATEMLREEGMDATAGGNLGKALSSQVAESRPGALHVVEVSSFQLESTDTFHPWVAALLNLSPDHLDRHASFAEYRAAKQRIFANQTSDDWAVVNADDAEAMNLVRDGRARRFDFALESKPADGVSVEGPAIVRRERGMTVAQLLPLSSVTLPGRHLLSDVLAAAAIGCLAGVSPEAMRRAVEKFRGLEHALERVAEIRGVLFVNDSKATNIVSTQKAIESFEQGLIVIMGGRFKGGRFEDLRPLLAGRVKAVIAIGEAQSLIRAALADLVPVDVADSMADAVRRAAASADAGDVVLLAPACSSFDMFHDYAERGRAFKTEVARLEA